MQPKVPGEVTPYARACLEALASENLGEYLSLGGAFALAHYLEYRTTHDVDAWWRDPVSKEVRSRVVGSIEKALRGFGPVHLRSWGDVDSVELEDRGKVVFSFRIARRSAQVEEPLQSPWPGRIGIDTLNELIASKMNALVERGAPRDFRDIHAVCIPAYIREDPSLNHV
jgi:hypothetical protein